MRQLTETDKAALEGMIDNADLASVLNAMEEIVAVKASHIRETWQDEGLAKRWESAGNRVNIARLWVSKLLK